MNRCMPNKNGNLNESSCKRTFLVRLALFQKGCCCYPHWCIMPSSRRREVVALGLLGNRKLRATEDGIASAPASLPASKGHVAGCEPLVFALPCLLVGKATTVTSAFVGTFNSRWCRSRGHARRRCRAPPLHQATLSLCASGSDTSVRR